MPKMLVVEITFIKLHAEREEIVIQDNNTFSFEHIRESAPSHKYSKDTMNP